MTTSLATPPAGAPGDGARRRTAATSALPESPEILPRVANGIPRSAWIRTRRLSTWHRPYAAGLLVLDYIAVVLADLTASTQLNQATSGFAPTPGHPEIPDRLALFNLIIYVLLPAAWLVVLWGNGAYDRRYLGIGTDEFKRVVRASLIVAAMVSFVAFSFKQVDLSRLSVATALVGAAFYLSLLRYGARRLLHLLRRRGRAIHRVLLVGALPDALGVYAAVTRNPAAGMTPVAIHVHDGYAATRGVKAPVPLYSGRDLVALVGELRADTVAVCGSASTQSGELRRLAWQLEGTGIDLVVAPQLTDIAGPRVHIRPVEGLPLLYVEEPTLAGVAWLVKNVMDRVVAALGLVLLSPLLLGVALAIRGSDKGPVFFRQPRVGREGKTFSVWKFRTMSVDAEDRLAALVDQNETDGLLFKIRDDPRITRVGRFLRASSLDELPQLINVVLGEMSLVGPRPLPAEDGDFLGDVRRRLLVRPGITGLWQVSGRSDLSWDDTVRLDLYYVDNWSLTFDLTIMWRTIGVVLRTKGAY